MLFFLRGFFESVFCETAFVNGFEGGALVVGFEELGRAPTRDCRELAAVAFLGLVATEDRLLGGGCFGSEVLIRTSSSLEDMDDFFDTGLVEGGLSA